MDRFAKGFLIFVIGALLALLLAYFMLNSAMKSPRGPGKGEERPQKSLPGSL